MTEDKYDSEGATPEERGFDSAAHETMATFLSRGPEASLPDPEALSASDKAELSRLVSRAAELNSTIKTATAEYDKVKVALRETVQRAGRSIPFDGASQYWEHPKSGMQVRLTTSAMTPVMDYDELRDLVGKPVFNKITRPVAFELVLEKVNKAVAEEVVTETQLAQCLHDPPPRKPSVYIEKAGKRERNDGKDKK